MEVVNMARKLSQFQEYFSPKVVGDINNFQVKLVKVRGEFMWHHHDHEDELFLIIKGKLRMKSREAGREREYMVGEGEFIIVPHGMEHMPIADDEVHLMLFEPSTTLNTGTVKNERTVEHLERI